MANPGAAQETPSAAVMSGFWRTTPPVAVRSPGVISVPLGFRTMRLGPSEEKLSVALREVKRPGYGPSGVLPSNDSAAGVAATLNAAAAALWPRVAADLPPSWVRNALSISGLFDLEPLRHAPFIRDALRLTPTQVRKASPAGLPAPAAQAGRGAIACVAGGAESSEFLRQNRLLRKHWGKAAVPVCEALPGLNHFSVLEALVQPRHRLHRLACELLGLT